MRHILALVVTTLLSLPSQAQIFQCSLGVYTDKPCEGSKKFSITYDAKPAGQGCRLENLVITIRGEILMPEWAEKSSAPSADQAYWDESYRGLKLHEDGHIQHGKEFAIPLNERLLGLGVVPCAELDARANQTHKTLYSCLQARDVEYDRRTSHGLR